MTDLLKERGELYGDIETTAEDWRRLYAIMYGRHGFDEAPAVVHYNLFLIIVKLARLTEVTWEQPDTWDDIAAMAKVNANKAREVQAMKKERKKGRTTYALNPCPFCGGGAAGATDLAETAKDKKTFGKCDNCGKRCTLIVLPHGNFCGWCVAEEQKKAQKNCSPNTLEST